MSSLYNFFLHIKTVGLKSLCFLGWSNICMCSYEPGTTCT